MFSLVAAAFRAVLGVFHVLCAPTASLMIKCLSMDIDPFLAQPVSLLNPFLVGAAMYIIPRLDDGPTKLIGTAVGRAMSVYLAGALLKDSYVEWQTHVATPAPAKSAPAGSASDKPLIAQ
jgi:hypothetical protein